MDNVKNILNKNNFEFKKKFGQNFLTDVNLLNAIVTDADITKEDDVLEIGPGAGTLTKAIAQKANKVVCYEIDKKLEPILKTSLNGFNNVEVVFKDIMNVTKEELKEHFKGSFKVVANLPYYITTPIMFKFIEGDFDIKSLTIMVQKEVAERITAKESTKSFGAITVSANYRGTAKITRIVGRQMFNPAPNVDSAIVNLIIDKNKFDIKNEIILNQLIKSAFHMRRKTLYNNLKASFDLPPETIKKIIAECNLKEAIRGEALKVEQFVELANILTKYL